MDDSELEKTVLEAFRDHGGAISNQELAGLFPDYLGPDTSAEGKQRLKKILGRIATLEKRTNSTILVLKSKYKSECGLNDSGADGLQSSILKALTRDSVVFTSDPTNAIVTSPSRKNTEITGEPSQIQSEGNIVTISIGMESEDESSQLISDAENLAKLLAPLAECKVGGDLSIQESTQPVIDEKQDVENEVEIAVPSQQPLPVDESKVSESQRIVQASASEPDLFRRPNPPPAVHHSGSDHDMVAGGKTLRPHVTSETAPNHRARHDDQRTEPSSEGKASGDRRAALQRSSVSSSKSGKSKQKDEGSDTSSVVFTSLSDVEREWLLVSSSVDYHRMCKLLLEYPELAKLVNFVNGYTALHWAAKKGHLDALKLLAGTHRVDVNRKTGVSYLHIPSLFTNIYGIPMQGLTPLHLAAMHNRRDAMNLLINGYGANPRLMDNSGRIPEAYLNNAYGTRRVNVNDTAQMATLPPKMSRLYGGHSGCSLTDGDGGLEPSSCSSTGRFARIGSIRQAGTAALNILRGHQMVTRVSNGLGSTSPVFETAHLAPPDGRRM